MAGDRAASSGEYEGRLATSADAFRPDWRLHGISAFLPQQNSAGWNAGRQGFAGIGAHSARDRKTKALDSGISAWVFAAAGRGWNSAGRTGDDPGRAVCDPGKGRAEAAGAGRGARREF